MKETKSWRVCAKTATAARLCVDCHPQKQTECKQTNWYETETGGAKNWFVQHDGSHCGLTHPTS